MQEIVKRAEGLSCKHDDAKGGDLDVIELLVVVVVGFVVIAALVLGILSYVFTKVKKRSQAVIDERFDKSDVVLADPMANFFGQQSKGLAQVRGNGALVLTKEKLWFRMVVPEKELEIPLACITMVKSDVWFLKKTKGRPLLIVEYDRGWGPDAGGWLVRDLESWMEALKRGAPDL